MGKPKGLIWGVVCLGLATGMAVAQTVTRTYEQTGNLVGASATSTGVQHQSSVNISPATLPGHNKDVYVVYWSSTVYGGPIPPPVPCPPPADPPPPPPDLVSTTVSGLIPASAILQLPSGDLKVDLDISTLETLQFVGSVRCIGGVCSPIPPPLTFPLKGTFTAVTNGTGAYVSSTTGNRSLLTVDPLCKVEDWFTGRQTDTSAEFTGQIGEILVPKMPLGANGQLHVQKGRWTVTLSCMLTPPM